MSAVPPPNRTRARLGVVLALLLPVAWFLRWTEALTPTGAALQRGYERTGAIGPLALILVWGLGVTALVARGADGIRRGAALTDGVLALVAALLFATAHPWVGAQDVAPVLAVVLLPLGLAAILDALGRRDEGVAWLRAAGALAACLAVALRPAPLAAGVLAWLAVSPLVLVGPPRDARDGRRRLYAVSALAAATAFFAADLQALLGGASEAYGTYEGRFAWHVLAAALVLIALVQVARPKGEGVETLP